MFETEKQIYLNMIGQNSIMKNSFLVYFSVDWPHTLKLQNNNTDASFQNVFDSMDNILDKHVPFKKITKYKLKFRTKP